MNERELEIFSYFSLVTFVALCESLLRLEVRVT
jgi:hypothetical protein